MFWRSIGLAIVMALSLPLMQGEVMGAEGDLLPRFVSLGAKRIYLRVGPSKTFPVAWELRQEGAPLEVILEYDSWRKVRDVEGTEGWAHKSMLTGKRAVVVLQGTHALYKRANDQSSVVAHVEQGVVGHLLQFTEEWCEIKLEGHKGWMRRESIWGIYPQERKSSRKCWLPFFCR